MQLSNVKLFTMTVACEEEEFDLPRDRMTATDDDDDTVTDQLFSVEGLEVEKDKPVTITMDVCV